MWPRKKIVKANMWPKSKKEQRQTCVQRVKRTKTDMCPKIINKQRRRIINSNTNPIKNLGWTQ